MRGCLGVLGLLLGGALLAACASSIQCHPHEDRCVQTGGYAEAAGTAIAAGAAWGAVGCRVNGCLAGWQCNDQTGYCEPLPCGEGHGSCPAGFECDLERRVCE